ncbi:hypothetical protein [Corynebacterium pacaense]|uniref:hypothetical protein n=1 Tax=Corynebacterium pacaense TaxID=1816684 RepID=UPI0009BAAA79|nr:hypothetical protein [Corynebacterium pacaense]
MRDHLPLVESGAIGDSAGVLRSAGFGNVRVIPLRRLHSLDSALGALPGHEVTLQYALTGIRR